MSHGNHAHGHDHDHHHHRPDFRLPAEWEPQDGVQLTWPHAASDWADMLDEVEPVFVAIAKAVSRFERLLVVCHDHALRHHVRQLLTAAGAHLEQCRLVLAPTNDTWARDHGAITVEYHGRQQPLSFRFNGWGGKFDATLDNAINSELASAGVFRAARLPEIALELEGGAIESDGEGTILTTSSCLTNPNRNGGLSKAEAEAQLKHHLGALRVLWLDHGYLAGDDTDSHIDTLARFAPGETIVYVGCDDPADEHYAELQAMKAELQALKTSDGHGYRLLELPWPKAVYAADGHRLPATYANYLIINDAVLVPVYNDAADEQALAVVAEAHPERTIIAINCLPLIEQHGSLHCVTMQFPRGTLA